MKDQTSDKKAEGKKENLSSTFLIGTKLISVSPYWEIYKGQWQPCLTIGNDTYSMSFLLPTSIAKIDSIITELNDGCYYRDIEGVGIVDPTESEKAILLQMVQDLSELMKPTISPFAHTLGDDYQIFKVGDSEVGVACEWFSNNGERWSFHTYLRTIGGESDTSVDNKEALKEILEQIGICSMVGIDSLYEYIINGANDKPNISAHDAYYGI